VDHLLRVYEPHECGLDGYPLVWHKIDVGSHAYASPGERYIPGVKHFIRAEADNRCERCKHPYLLGTGVWGEDNGILPATQAESLLSLLEDPDIDDRSASYLRVQMQQRPPLWSPCDLACRHLGPLRWRDPVSAEKGRGWLTGRDDVPVQSFTENGMEVQASWRVLTVHHLNGRKFDLRWWNLAALCQRCHLEIQNKVTMERVYPFEHTAWFKPHAAGWYSYVYEGRDIDRDEAVDRLDELLALERMV
jgi:hypothetical protein